MKIRKLHIDGFGIFNDKKIEGFTKGVNLLYGPNEKGKSTLLDFFKFTLFDYPRLTADRRPPLRGGNHGGEIELSSGEKKIKIYRSGTKSVQLAVDGAIADIQEYQRLISYAEIDLYENIFAITLDELKDNQYVEESDIGNRIFSLGMGIDVDLGKFEKSLKDKSEQLFKPAGSTQKIILLKKEIDEKVNKIRTLESAGLNFDKKAEELADLQQEIKQKREEERGLEIMKNRCLSLLKAYPHYVVYQQNSEKLKTFSNFQQFPSLLQEEYKENKTKLETYLENLKRLEGEQNSLKEELSNIVIDEALQQELELLEPLKANVQVYKGNLERHKKGLAFLKENQAELEIVSAGYEVEVLLAIQQLQSLQDFAEEYAEKINKIKENIGFHQNAISTIKSDLTFDRQELDKQEAALEALSIANEQQYRAAKEKLALLEVEHLVAAPSISETNKDKLLKIIALSSAAALFVFIIAKALGIRLPSNTFIEVLLYLTMLVSLMFLLFKKKSRLDAPSHKDIREAFLQKNQLDENIKAYLAQQENIQQLQKMCNRKKHDIEETTNKIELAKQEIEEIKETWKNKLSTYGVYIEVPIHLFERFLNTVQKVQNHVKVQKNAQKEIRQLEKEIDNFQTLLLKYNKERTTSVEAVQQLISQLEEEKEKRGKRDFLQNQLKEKEQGIETLHKQVELIEEKISEKLKQVGVKDEVAFYNYFDQLKEHKHLLQVYENAKNGIQEHCGFFEEFDEAIKILSAKNKEVLEQDLKSVEIQLETKKTSLSALDIRSGELNAEMDSLLQGNDLFLLNNEKNSLIERYSDALKKWISYEMALEVLNESKRKYEKEKQPEVIHYTKKYFEIITDGAYVDVNISLSDRQMRAIDAQGKSKEIQALSRGTKEQLLLAVRMGLIEEYEKKAEPLPVILDDIMVNFDDKRAQNVAKALTAFAKDRQVLLFTCHTHFKALFEAENANIIPW